MFRATKGVLWAHVHPLHTENTSPMSQELFLWFGDLNGNNTPDLLVLPNPGATPVADNVLLPYNNDALVVSLSGETPFDKTTANTVVTSSASSPVLLCSVDATLWSNTELETSALPSINSSVERAQDGKTSQDQSHLIQEGEVVLISFCSLSCSSMC